jgi:hypothetical protein
MNKRNKKTTKNKVLNSKTFSIIFIKRKTCFLQHANLF